MNRQSIVIATLAVAFTGLGSSGSFGLNPQPEPPGIFRVFQNFFAAPTALRDPKTGKLISVNKLPVGLCRSPGYFEGHSTGCINLGIRQGLSPQ